MNKSEVEQLTAIASKKIHLVVNSDDYLLGIDAGKIDLARSLLKQSSNKVPFVEDECSFVAPYVPLKSSTTTGTKKTTFTKNVSFPAGITVGGSGGSATVSINGASLQGNQIDICGDGRIIVDGKLVSDVPKLSPKQSYSQMVKDVRERSKSPPPLKRSLPPSNHYRNSQDWEFDPPHTSSFQKVATKANTHTLITWGTAVVKDFIDWLNRPWGEPKKDKQHVK